LTYWQIIFTFQECASLEEREVAASLLELSGKRQPFVPEIAFQVAQPPKKRGRKPKIKKITPKLMKQTKKAFNNYVKCFTIDKV
jgi:hypothetical protein